MPVTTVTLNGYRTRAEYRATPAVQIGVAAPPPEPGRGCLLCHPGEVLLAGTPAQLRAVASARGRRTFVPVHFALEGDWELLGIEPRGLGPAAVAGQIGEERMDTRIRIAATAAPVEAPGPQPEPWQQMRSALLQELRAAGAGVPAMAALAQTQGIHPLWQALALRNLAVALAARGSCADALALLEQARSAHPEYRELHWLAAKLLLDAGQPRAAFGALQHATRTPSGPPETLYVGSGGEASYRAHCLMAHIAARSGTQAVAVNHYLTGVLARPAYEPSVVGLLQQRVPLSLLPGLDAPLLRLGRLEARYQSAILAWWLLHRRWAMAARALRVWPMQEAERQRAREQVQAVQPRARAPREAGVRAGVVLQGPFLMVASSARINRYLGAALLRDEDLDAALEPSLPGEETEAALATPEGWARGLHRLPRRLDFTVRHGWPPEFTRPAAGKLALILPWEFGALPRRWLAPLNRTDKIWTPSAFVREALLRAGVESGRVSVIPNGVNPAIYCPEGARRRPEGARGTCFLFVGGAIARKGMDVLLAAWRQAFRAEDDVTLVIKDMGASTFYRHLSLAGAIASVAREPGVAPILYRHESYSEPELAALYRGCDVLVLPYRGEGFGMPLAEALACGKPVITTAAGPAPEFCPAACAWWVRAQEQEVPASMRPPEAMTGPFTWFEPQVDSLVKALRTAASTPAAERARRGALGTAHLQAHYGWDQITAQYRTQLKDLL